MSAVQQHPSWCDVEDACIPASVNGDCTVHRRIFDAGTLDQAVEASQWVEDGNVRQSVTVYRYEDISRDDALALARALKDAAGVFDDLDEPDEYLLDLPTWNLANPQAIIDATQKFISTMIVAVRGTEGGER